MAEPNRKWIAEAAKHEDEARSVSVGGPEQDLIDAANALAKTKRGRSAMMYLLNWLDDDGLGLDSQSKERILTLLDGAFGSFPGTARDAMRDAISDLDAHAKKKYCSVCDGCGWYEGGKAIKTECRTCGGTGLVEP